MAAMVLGESPSLVSNPTGGLWRSPAYDRRPFAPIVWDARALASRAGYAYSDNYLIDLKHAVIMDVEAATAIRQAEVGAAKTMLDRPATTDRTKAGAAPATVSGEPFVSAGLRPTSFKFLLTMRLPRSS